MKLKVNKAALSCATAVMMVTQMVSMLGTSASAANEIRLVTDKTSAAPGERISVSVDYIPNEAGASGMTLELHYDPDQVEVHIPTAQEAETIYNVPSSFSVITNYAYSEGIVRIIGANLLNTNIENETSLTLASFDVREFCEGDIEFWVDVETMVTATDGGFEASPFMTSPISVSGPEVSDEPYNGGYYGPEDDDEEYDEYTEVVEDDEEEEVEIVYDESELENDPDYEIDDDGEPVTYPESSADDETTTTPQPVTTTTTTTEAAVTTTTPEAATTTTTIAQAAAVEETKQSTTTTKAAEAPAYDLEEESSEEAPLFSYHQSEGDFNSEEIVSYNIHAADYVTDYSKHYDVMINVQASANANGGVGMIINGQYLKQNNKLRTGGEETWVVEDLDPMSLGSDLVVALYYMKANSDFSVNSVKFVERKVYAEPVGTPLTDAYGAVIDQDDDDDDNSSSQSEDDEDTDDDSTGSAASSDDSKDSIDDNNTATESTADESSESSEADDQEADDAEGKAEVSFASSVKKADGAAESTDDSDSSGIGEDQSAVITTGASKDSDSSTDKSVQPAAKDIEEAVIHASQQADSSSDKSGKSGKNPSTGESHLVRKLIMIVCGGYIVYSLAALVEGHIVKKKEQ